MRMRLFLIISLVVGITVVSYFFAVYQVGAEKKTLKQEVIKRSELFAESLEVSVEPLIQSRSFRTLKHLVEGFGNRERLAGVIVYDERGGVLATNSDIAHRLKGVPAVIDQAIAKDAGNGAFLSLNQELMYVYALPIHREQKVAAVLAVYTDASYIDAQSAQMWRATFVRILVEMLIIALITVFVIRWTMMGRIAKMTQWLQELRAGKVPPHPTFVPEEDMFKPLAQEVTHLARSLAAARAAAEEEARLREAGESLWTAERLRIFVQSKLEGSRLIAVSNREPYEHVSRGKEVIPIVPASGLVTALEPILRACDGTWVAHGGGDADRETVDANDRLRVPPDDPHYTLRRVWLSKEEIEGYYYGFANEGLWPLCHIAHTRPTFRAEDWAFYEEANRKFAKAVIEEMEGAERPIVLVQDYHFALLPRLIKENAPYCRVAIFWHIPWPNPEAFGICPWQRELLEGLLGADLIGFHIQSHCNNFLETIDRTLESRIEWERFAVNKGGHFTLVRPFPISVDFKEPSREPNGHKAIRLERDALLKQLGVEADYLGIGVDRLDYTKGIPERFRGIERFLEKYASYNGHFTFVQIGAPSRTRIDRYQDLTAEVEHEAERINRRFQSKHWKPIVFLKRHHNHAEIEPFYRHSDLCLVTSLHDGMNLVAKEYVATRDDNGGSLVLSCFTGASRELQDALIVNPYDTEELAEAIHKAVAMDARERRERMRRMR